jgi:hypothetical protein
MSTLLDNATFIKNNIVKFIVDVLVRELDSFSIEENAYQTGAVITCHYKTEKGKLHSISADYLYSTTQEIIIKCSANPGLIRDFYWFFMSKQENAQLHLIKESIDAVLREFQVGDVHMKFNAQPMGEIYHDKKRKSKYCIHKEMLQGKISFESHFNEFSFMNARLKSKPYYYLDDCVLKSSKMIQFVITAHSFSLDLKDDEDFLNRVNTMCGNIYAVVLKNAVSTISEKFCLDDISCFSEDDIKRYLTLMTMENI